MNVNLLIDNIVRQTTLLVAQLATAAGGRTPLAHVAGQVFLDLVRELTALGLVNMVIADMFGLSLRTYHDRVRRLSESATDRGASLWQAVLEFVQGKGTVTRAAVLKRFHADDALSVRGVLNDLVETGLLFKSGRSDTTTYRAVSAEELTLTGNDPSAALAHWVWVVLHSRSSATAAGLALQLGLEQDIVERALATLLAEQRVALDPSGAYRADRCIIPFGAEHGWEAAVFDHFQAMVTAIIHKLDRGQSHALPEDAIGGSTYHFDLYPGHPRERDVLGLLASVRAAAGKLRGELEAGQEGGTASGEAVSGDGRPGRYRVVFYAGQNLVMQDAGLMGDSEP